MRRLAGLALLGAGLVMSGSGAQPRAGEPFTPGNVVVAGAGLRQSTHRQAR